MIGTGVSPRSLLLAYRMPRVDRDQGMVYLYETAVVPERRRRGVGSELSHRLKKDCRVDNIMKIWVGTEADNVAARALYESTGAELRGGPHVEYSYSDS